MLITRGSGLIVHLSFLAARQNHAGVAYMAANAATDRMAAAMAHELREHRIAVVSLYPGLVRTESVLQAAGHFDLSNSESSEFVGRAAAALAGDPRIMDKSGRVLVAAELAIAYGFRDIDGKQPRPLSESGWSG